MTVEISESEFETISRAEMNAIEDALADVDPDDIDVSVSDGVLRLDLRDGTRVVINSHRAARQIWMAAVASAWHFDPPARPYGRAEARGQAASLGPAGAGVWRSPKSSEELRPTLRKLVRERIGVELPLVDAAT